MAIKHTKVAVSADEAGKEVNKAEWNADHTIEAGTVTLAMQADMATASVVYRKTAGTGAPEANSLATLKTDLLLTGTNSGDQTNISGNAATVTTNANLTGHITSTGNAAVLGSFTKAQLDAAISDDNSAYLATVQAFTKTQSVTPVALSVASNLVAVDLALSNNFTLTLQATTGQTLSNPTNAVAGTSGQIAITQNATPSTLAYGANWIEATTGLAIAVSTTANTKNLLSYYVFDATTIFYVLNKRGTV